MSISDLLSLYACVKCSNRGIEKDDLSLVDTIRSDTKQQSQHFKYNIKKKAFDPRSSFRNSFEDLIIIKSKDYKEYNPRGYLIMVVVRPHYS